MLVGATPAKAEHCHFAKLQLASLDTYSYESYATTMRWGVSARHIESALWTHSFHFSRFSQPPYTVEEKNNARCSVSILSCLQDAQSLQVPSLLYSLRKISGIRMLGGFYICFPRTSLPSTAI